MSTNRDGGVGEAPHALTDAPLKGALLMMAAMFAAAAIDTSVKALAGSYSTGEIVLLRTLFAIPVTLGIAHTNGGIRAGFRAQLPAWQLYRGALGCGATFGFFYGLSFLPLVTAVLLAYVAPLLVVLLSYPLLREKVGLRRSVGVLVGFGGTMCIVQPDSLSLHPAVLAVLFSSLCWALMVISNRQLAGRESPATLAIYTLPLSGALAAVLTVGDWVTPRPNDWPLFVIAGVGAASIHFLAASASRFARAATLAPFEYTNLVWVALAAWMFWAELPDLWTLAGGSAVLVGGFIAVRGR